ncbi:hypothetical protein [uncultured Microbacterium sp.]|uniref:MurR/RpiR family transcriptional regulator n=1 Tax=uncultured Microbacterium sp. TaxID=191216 RepID=UPI0025D81CE9|nr:hypothetical protein [uncultured Microbacterium sp.]
MDTAVDVDTELGQYTTRHFSLLNSLLNVLNTVDPGDPQSVIARYLLENFDRLGELNVYDMAAACFTSRSGIRRFCESILYKNFSDLKAFALEWDIHAAYFAEFADHPRFREDLSGGIQHMVTSVDALITREQLDGLAALIHDSSSVVFVSSSFAGLAVQDFQRALLLQHKLTEVVTDSVGREARIEELAPADLIVVVSATGVYGRVVSKQLAASTAHKVLVTMNPAPEFASAYDSIFRLADDDAHCGGRAVFAKYAMVYFFDLLCNRYHELFPAAPTNDVASPTSG